MDVDRIDLLMVVSYRCLHFDLFVHSFVDEMALAARVMGSVTRSLLRTSAAIDWPNSNPGDPCSFSPLFHLWTLASRHRYNKHETIIRYRHRQIC